MTPAAFRLRIAPTELATLKHAWTAATDAEFDLRIAIAIDDATSQFDLALDGATVSEAAREAALFDIARLRLYPKNAAAGQDVLDRHNLAIELAIKAKAVTTGGGAGARLSYSAIQE